MQKVLILPRPLFNTMDLPKNQKHCPLCLKKWTVIQEKKKPFKIFVVCLLCEISIWLGDVLFGSWTTMEAVKCPTCKNHDMRFFCRSDEYCVFFCPNCKTKIESMDPDKHKKINNEIKPEDLIA